MIARFLLPLLIILAGLILLTGLQASGPRSTTVDTQTGTPAFAEDFHERLLVVQAAADALVELGETRERNLLVVGQRQSAMNNALDATDAWLVQRQLEDDDPAITSYRAGAALIRQAMSDAQSAFFRLDWDEVARANATLAEGVDHLRVAISLVAGGESN